MISKIAKERLAQLVITKNDYVAARNGEHSILLAPMEEYISLRKKVAAMEERLAYLEQPND